MIFIWVNVAKYEYMLYYRYIIVCMALMMWPYVLTDVGASIFTGLSSTSQKALCLISTDWHCLWIYPQISHAGFFFSFVAMFMSSQTHKVTR